MCQGEDTLTLLNNTQQICQLDVASTHTTKAKSSLYNFKISCENFLRNDSEVLLSLSTYYAYSNNGSDIECWSDPREVLETSSCSINYINGSYFLKADTIIINKD